MVVSYNSCPFSPQLVVFHVHLDKTTIIVKSHHPFPQITPGLPKTRSGKIMRRILRKVAENKPEELGDVSTLADPPIVSTIVEKHQQKYGTK